MPLRPPLWNPSVFRPVDRLYDECDNSVRMIDLTYHVEEGGVGEEGGGPEYAPMNVGFEIDGRGRGDADDGLHGDRKMRELRPANSQEEETQITKRK